MTDIVTLCMNPSIDVSTSVDNVVFNSKLRCGNVQRDPGGGGVNVARVAHRFGADVTAIFPAGGSAGQLLRRLVDQEGVPSLAISLSEETREDLTILENKSGKQFRFILPGPELSAREWGECLNAIASFKGRAHFLVASGSLPPGVPEDFYGRIAHLAKNMGTRLVLDTSGKPLEAALKEGVYVVKPNLHELADLVKTRLDDEDSWVEACRSLVHAGSAQVVALTLGEQGSLLVTDERAWRAQPLPVKPVGAVGAGDSFVGGMVWSLVSGRNMEETFRYASAAGSAAVLGRGTELCRKEDTERFYDQLTIRAIAYRWS
jgi:6-phosphofructokinase 2